MVKVKVRVRVVVKVRISTINYSTHADVLPCILSVGFGLGPTAEFPTMYTWSSLPLYLPMLNL